MEHCARCNEGNVKQFNNKLPVHCSGILMAGNVVNPSKFEESLKTLRLSVLELWVLTYPIGYHWQCVYSLCTCAISRDLCTAANFSHIFEIPDPDLPIHYTTSMALRRRLRAVYSCISNVKDLFRLKIYKYEIGPKISKMEDDLQETLTGCQKSKYSCYLLLFMLDSE